MTEFTINTPGMKVLRLHEKHIDEIIELMNREGWYYYDHHELKRYLNLNQDCFTFLKDGFHAEAFTTSQEAELPLKLEYEEMDLGKNIMVERLEAHDLDAVGEIDERYFKSKRLRFLKNLYNDSIKESCFCLKDQKKVVGFLMVRRRKASKDEGRFAEGPDYAYRLGPSCVMPEYGIRGFKALCQKAMRAVNEEIHQLGGSARIYAVFPKNANKEEVYEDTRELAKAMDMDANLNLDRVFNEHDLIFGVQKSKKNKEQWKYMENLGFHQEYFEQVMCYTPGEAANTQPSQRKGKETRADTEGIFALATPGDKS